MKFTLIIETGNAQMQSAGEVAESLSVVTRRIMAGDESGKIFDVNGNSIGSFTLSVDD